MPLDAAQFPLTVSNHLKLPLVAVTAILVSWALYSRSQRAQKLPLPPGPKSDPVIGHLRALPTSDEHRVYARWGKELNSDIISITIFGQTIIVLNSAEAANELLDRRSAIYSSRGELPMVTHPDLVDWSRNTALLPYGERWRSQRRMTHKELHKVKSTQFWPLIVKQSRMAAQHILSNPDNFIREIRRMTGSTLLSAVYGYEVTSANDPLVEIVETAVAHLCDAAVPGNFFVNTMPWLRHVPDWFPGTRWKQTVKAWRKEKEEMVDVPFEWAKNQIVSGVAGHSITKSLLADLENISSPGPDRAEEEDRIKWVTGTLFGAGTDTSAAVILVFILAMTLHPHVLVKAQTEIDEVVGQDRLPEMTDRESLPYIECVLKEVLRWQPVAPVGKYLIPTRPMCSMMGFTALPHTTTDNDEYKGHFIPKGAVVVGNVWAISYDESVYFQPERFNPDRFLSEDVPKPPAFGFGRRACPGVDVAESVLFITMTTLLAAFNIRPARDEQGNEIIPEVNMKSNAIVSYPADFECSITPRSENSMQLLKICATEQGES